MVQSDESGGNHVIAYFNLSRPRTVNTVKTAYERNGKVFCVISLGVCFHHQNSFI